MEFQKVVSTGGIEEYSNIQNDLADKSNYLEYLYNEVQDKIRLFVDYEGYTQIDEIQENLEKMNNKICELSSDILDINNNLTE